MNSVNLKTDLIMSSISKFYKEPQLGEQRINIIKSILEGKHKLSLRILDWFVTNYAKKNIIFLNGDDIHNIYQIYKLKLKGTSKIYFDPFNRRYKIEYYYTDTKFLSTTPAQLCFFKWCFEYNILIHVEKHYAIIENDMKLNIKEKSLAKRQPIITHVNENFVADFN